MQKVTNSRRRAAFIFAKWLATKDFPATLLPEGPDRGFIQDVTYTAIRHLRTLRLVLGKLLRKWPKGELESLLYIGAAQLLYMPSVPDFAAVSETVEAAKTCSNPNVAKVVNGVLRSIIRQKDALKKLVEEAPLGDRESFPTILCARWTERYGAEKAEALCNIFNEPAETFLAYPDGRYEALPHGRKVTDVAGYAAGAFIVQDPATALAVELMDVQAGETVLDACAAPGGKAIQLAWRGAALTACEVNPKRRRRLEENFVRLGIKASVLTALPQPSALNLQPFNKILVDAPCSNTGVLRRRPDARWNWSEEKLAALVKLQGEILDHVAPLVAPGGTLVYSTCSLEPEENEDQVKAFLARHPDFTLGKTLTSLPFETSHDGAFAAQLCRK